MQMYSNYVFFQEVIKMQAKDFTKVLTNNKI